MPDEYPVTHATIRTSEDGAHSTREAEQVKKRAQAQKITNHGNDIA